MVRSICSRTQPCDSCLRTGDADTCSYVARPNPRNYGSLDQNTKEMLIARISRLEDLLLTSRSSGKNQESIYAKPGQSGKNSDLDTNLFSNSGSRSYQPEAEGQAVVDDVAEALGSMKVDHVEKQTIYLGGAHWVSIMCEVSCVSSI